MAHDNNPSLGNFWKNIAASTGIYQALDVSDADNAIGGKPNPNGLMPPIAPQPQHAQQHGEQSPRPRPRDSQLAVFHFPLPTAHTISPNTTAISVVAISSVRREKRRGSQRTVAVRAVSSVKNQCGTQVVPFQ